ncbi:Crp/Fnr family transcriptional regulator [Dyadobacter sp. CY312]|uniref:Crp/Fnr family transcriptional regulator n=1 Tax=Dyadobacter sp. CY312 TaxID=2907303 RepID=UPI001F26A316|nr:Crp/Fnr family transcriptional regulator [Dyadobacter sp. CY312]MCE7040829.1 Crp/Fnr family transcriptional regulator [Dyadobacter sp. CY312]
MTEIEMLGAVMKQFAGMEQEAFALSHPFWQKKTYKKGEFYNEYKNVCKHLGFILNGVFRTYYTDSEEEKNVFFFSQNQIVVSYKSFVTQTPCNYYTESMTEATILYIHYDHLQKLYRQSQQWEKFGRLVAETAFDIAMTRAEHFLFLTPEQRYLDLLEKHPDIFNNVPLYHIASYLGIQGPSLSRIRKRMSKS